MSRQPSKSSRIPMKFLDVLLGVPKEKKEVVELRTLFKRLQPFIADAEDRRDELCKRIITNAFDASRNNPPEIIVGRAWQFCQSMLGAEGYLYIPPINMKQSMTTGELWENTAAIKRALAQFEDREKNDIFVDALAFILHTLTDGLPIFQTSPDEWASLSVPLYTLLPDARLAIDKIFSLFNFEPTAKHDILHRFLGQLFDNVRIASKMNIDQPVRNPNALVFPSKADMPIDELILTYFGGTPLVEFLLTPLPFSIP